TKKTKKNQLKQQYGNFKAEGSETLEQTFNRLQAIVSHLEFIDVEIERDTLIPLVVPKVDLIGDEDPTDEDGDTEVLVSLGEISSEGKKYWESDIGDCDNIGDGGKIAGRAIITWDGEIALYACMASIYGSSCKGEKISMLDDVAVYYHFAISTFPVKIVTKSLLSFHIPLLSIRFPYTVKSSNHPIIVPSDFNIEDAFSSTNSPNYLSVFSNYFPTIPRNNSPNSSNDLTKYLLDILIFSPLHDYPYMEAMQAYNAISPSQVIIALPDTKTSVSPSSSVGSSSPIRSTISPLDYPFDESIFAELDNSLWITPRPLGEEPVPEESNELDACWNDYLCK
nr:hypothetical protein [Tanacetum cinerariifolium]